MADMLTERRGVMVDMGVDGRRIVGYCAVFDSIGNLGEFDEVIEPGAFTPALKHPRSSGIVALFNHDANYVLGRLGAGTLKLHEDKRGLFAEIDPPETQFVNDLRTSIARGDIKGQSFFFSTAIRNTRWEMRSGRATRVIRQFDELVDVGPTAVPVYPATTASLRCFTDWKSEADKLAANEAKLARLEARLKA